MTGGDEGAVDGYAVVARLPSVAEYRRLREVAGLTPRSREAAAAGLPNTCHAVVVEHAGRAVGMGRIVGDGALCFTMVDIAVEPGHQGRGLGKRIVGALMEALARGLSAEAHICLFADGEAHRLYAQYGFEPTAPASIGMARWLERT